MWPILQYPITCLMNPVIKFAQTLLLGFKKKLAIIEENG